MIREATLEDLAVLTEICNSHERRVDPNSEDVSSDEVKQNMVGWQEPGHPVVHLNANSQIDAHCFITPDTPRSRVEFDLYYLNDVRDAELLSEYSSNWWRENHPSFELRTVCNTEDTELCKVFEDQGFYLKRIYWKLIKTLDTETFPELIDSVVIRKADWNKDARLIHKLETDSFSEHFAFTKLEFQDWHAQNERDELRDLDGYAILEVAGEPVGYSLASNARANLNGGYVDKLGVLAGYRGNGYGKLLLRWQFAHAASKGFDSIALGVDSGNESGALDLYFGLGFTKCVAWAAYCKDPLV